MSKGIVFNIQKFSIHDGPGIRTTVFLKGCPLRCAWCSNPESQSSKIQLLYDQNKCICCMSCVNTCPKHALTMEDNRIHIAYTSCNGCLQCEQSCFQNALYHEGDYKEVAEIVDICLQDKAFYEESGGGVTISGGEGMSQPQFLQELINALKIHDIAVAIETTGYIPTATFQTLASQLDLLLFDVKHYDTNKHYAGTGVHNEQIIHNLTWAIANGINVLPRIPVIPDFNASLKDAQGLAQLLLTAGAKRVQLLPFHQFGEKKYELLHREYALKDKKALYPEDLQDYQQIFIDKGLDCFF